MGKYDFEFDLFEDNTLSWIAGEVEKNSKVLEFGAANGRLTRYLSQSKGCKVDIVEIDEESGLEAAEYAENSLVGIEKGDIEKYYWLQEWGGYDFIIFADVLEHLVNPREVLNRCKAVLKKSGKMLVSIPNVSHNSIIIELINDRFHYTPIGLLDNTHLRFFTRQSFTSMVEQVGWAVVGEKAKYIRVGENEIQNSYQDVPKEVFKALIRRDSGNIYQYMFTLALSSEYLLGQCERKVCLDSFSYYFTEAFYENDGSFDYKKSVSRHINPGNGAVNVTLEVLENCKKVQIHPLNCNCVVHINQIFIHSNQGIREVYDYEHNASVIADNYYFINGAPEIELWLQEGDTAITLDMNILNYDFDEQFLSLYRDICDRDLQIKKICEDYEKEISKKDQEFQESVKTYEAMIAQKDREFKESVETYEQVIAQKDKEIQKYVKVSNHKLQNSLGFWNRKK